MISKLDDGRSFSSSYYADANQLGVDQPHLATVK